VHTTDLAGIWSRSRSLCYSCALFRIAASTMIETNPVRDQIADLKRRILALRGFL
jgi:hypothetical protein